MLDTTSLFVYEHIAFIFVIDYMLFELKDKEKISSKIFYISQIILLILIVIDFYFIQNTIK
mgnify:CR=1 FL=1|jgi:hypothetical protein